MTPGGKFINQSKIFFSSLYSGTNQQIVVVVGGEYIFNSNDTEMLIDGRWQRGPSMQISMSIVHFDGDLYAIGKRK